MTRVAHAPAVAGLSGAPLSRYTGDIETPAALVAWARQAQGRGRRASGTLGELLLREGG